MISHFKILFSTVASHTGAIPPQPDNEECKNSKQKNNNWD